MHRTAGRVAALLAPLVSLPIAARQAQPPQFGTANRTVAVYATVTNAQGRLVPDLTRDDFTVSDNGKPQALTLFSNDVQPITVIMLLDRSGSMKANFDLEERAAEAFVHEMLPGDKARIGSFAKYIQIDPEDFTSDQAKLIKILKTELQSDGPTPLWNAVDRGIDKLLIEQGRRVILVFTDGVDMPMDFNAKGKSLKDVMTRAEEHDVMVYAIGLAGQTGMTDGGRGTNRGAFGGLGGRGLGGFLRGVVKSHRHVALGDQVDRADFLLRRLDGVEQPVEPRELRVDLVEAEGDLRALLIGDDEAVAFREVDVAHLEARAVGVQPHEFERGLNVKGVHPLAGHEIFRLHAGDDREVPVLRQKHAAAQDDAARIDEKRVIGGRGVFLFFQNHPGDWPALGDDDRHAVRKCARNFRALDLRQLFERRARLAEIDSEDVASLDDFRRAENLLPRQRAIRFHIRLADKIVGIFPDTAPPRFLAAEPHAGDERTDENCFENKTRHRAESALALFADAEFHVEQMLLFALARAGDAFVRRRFHVRRARERAMTRAHSSA